MAVPGYAHAPFSPKFLMGFSTTFVRMDPMNIGYWPNLKSVALPVPEIIAIGVLDGGGEAIEDGGWYRSKERW